jgi:hypothetical protein
MAEIASAAKAVAPRPKKITVERRSCFMEAARLNG